MPREPTQIQPPKGRHAPGTYSPDDDEAQESDVTRASDMDAPDPLDVAANEEIDSEQGDKDIERPEDEDESDHIAERP